MTSRTGDQGSEVLQSKKLMQEKQSDDKVFNYVITKMKDKENEYVEKYMDKMLLDIVFDRDSRLTRKDFLHRFMSAK